MRIQKIHQREFFRSLFRNAEASSLVEMRYTLSQGFGEGRIQRIWGEAGDTDGWLEKASADLEVVPHNFHFTPALRKTRSGKKDAVECIPALWTDIDNIVEEDARRLLSDSFALGMAPNLAASSGWGFYFFWILDSPSTDTVAAESANRTIASLFLGDTNAVNVSHTLRLPGSLNCKTPIPKRVVPYAVHDGTYDEKNFFGMLEESKKALVGSTKPRFYKNDGNGSEQSSSYSGTNGNFESCAAPDWNTIVEETAGCPLIETAVNHADKLGYAAWMSLAGAIFALCGENEGRKAFHDVSSRSSSKYSPESAERAWRETVEKGLRPWRCEKTEEGAHCTVEGCRGLLSTLGKAFRKTAKNQQRE